MIKGAIFDLDGTLLNTIEDIADSMNSVLLMHKEDVYSYKEYKNLVGRGFTNLVYDTFSKELDIEEHDEILAKLNKEYAKRYLNKTKPYIGILELLKKLEKKGVKLAVNTNKNEEYAVNILKEKLGEIDFKIIIGKREDIPLKPDKTGVEIILKELDLNKEEVIYIGDSNVDMLTGKNSGLKTIGVNWGFRGEKELKEYGADYIAYKADDIFNIITKL